MKPLTRAEVEAWPPLGPMSIEKERVLALIRKVRRDALEEAAHLVGTASGVRPSLFDGLATLTWEEFNETTKSALHGGSQMLAAAIRDLKKMR